MIRGRPLSRRRWLAASSAVLAGAIPGALGAESQGEPANKLAPIRAKLDQLAAWVRGKRGKLSALAVDLASGERAHVDATSALNPASNMKVVTSAAALDLLGPTHTFETSLYGNVAPEMKTLVLRGNGDPSLTESGLWRLANALSGLGVVFVETLFVDQSRFDARFVPPAFDQQPSEWAAFRAPVSAIAVERNTVTLNVAPEAAGSPARTWFQPAGVVTVEGEIPTKKTGSGQNILLSLTPAERGLLAKVGGHVAEGLPRQRFSKRVDDPRLLPGFVLKALLEREGVKVGNVAPGGAEHDRRITFHGSDALSELIAELGKHSDNFYAEMVFKALAFTESKGPATWEGAASVVRSWLHKSGALDEGTRIENGSGLFDANRLSAETLVTVLTKVQRSPRLQNEFMAHLAIGGVDGTLRSRFRSHAESRRVRAKTGTLAAAHALSGYVLREGNAPPLAFALLVDGVSGQHGAVRAKLDEVVEALASV